MYSRLSPETFVLATTVIPRADLVIFAWLQPGHVGGRCHSPEPADRRTSGCSSDIHFLQEGKNKNVITALGGGVDVLQCDTNSTVTAGGDRSLKQGESGTDQSQVKNCSLHERLLTVMKEHTRVDCGPGEVERIC